MNLNPALVPDVFHLLMPGDVIMLKTAGTCCVLLGSGFLFVASADGKDRKCYQYCWPEYWCQPAPQLCRPHATFRQPCQPACPPCWAGQCVCPLYPYACFGEGSEAYCSYYSQKCDEATQTVTYVSMDGAVCLAYPKYCAQTSPFSCQDLHASCQATLRMLYFKGPGATGSKLKPKPKSMDDKHTEKHGAKEIANSEKLVFFDYAAKAGGTQTVFARVRQFKTDPKKSGIPNLPANAKEMTFGIGYEVDVSGIVITEPLHNSTEVQPTGAHGFKVTLGGVSYQIVTHENTPAAQLP